MELLTVREAAAMLRVSQVTLRRYVASGQLPAVRVGRNVRLDRTSAEACATPAAAPSPADEMDELAHVVPKLGFAPESSIWRLAGFVEADGPTDVASDMYKELPQVYGDLHEGEEAPPRLRHGCS